MGRVDGKVVLISGGARGMGASHGRRLVAEGASVVLGDILDDEGTALAREIGDAARYVHLDVTRPEDWAAAVQTATDTFGGLHGLVNNAGIMNGSTLQRFRLDKWQQIIDVNLTGTFLGMQAAADALIAAGGGSIVNVSSIEGLQGGAFVHGYVASKWAVRGITKSAALELAQHNVRVNSLHPGMIRTAMTDGVPDGALAIPLHRSGESDEVASMVLFLISDESSYSTGSEFVVDGGVTAGIMHEM